MRIGFDIGPITHARSGVGNYCLHLLKALMDVEGLDISGFAAQARTLDLEAVGRPLRHRRLPIPTRAMYRIWSTLGMPAVDSLLGGVDVYHATNYFLPPTKRAKRVLTIHDITFKKHPELCSPKIVGPFASKVEGFAREADAVIADSVSTRQDVIESLGAKPERVHTVHLACDESMSPIDKKLARERVAALFGSQHPYLLFVGTVEPRKNVKGILTAFKKVEKEFPHRLVICGGPGWMSDKDQESILELRRNISEQIIGHPDGSPIAGGRVIRTGFAAPTSLTALYSAADALIFPSFYEGFGLPVLEAMACGCPVITANNSSLPEVAGDAAEYCDANDVDSIANAMRRVLSDESLREQMRQRGFAQAAKFSWKKAAEQTAAVYRSVCG